MVVVYTLLLQLLATDQMLCQVWRVPLSGLTFHHGVPGIEFTLSALAASALNVLNHPP